MRGRLLGSLGIFLHAFPFVAAGQTQTDPQLAAWNNSVSGSWIDSSRWSTAPFFPRNDNPAGVRYAAEISAGGTPYVVTIDAGSLAGNEITVDDFLLNASDATVRLTRDTFTVVNSFAIDAGTFQLDGGTIRNSTIGGSGGEVSVRTSGTLDNVTLARTMQVTAPLTARNNLTLDGGVLQFAPDKRLDFDGTQHLTGNGDVRLSTDEPNAGLGYLRAISGILTIDNGVTIRGGGYIGFSTGGIINDSMISADSTNAWLRIFNDPGLPQQFLNRGILEATAGGTLHLDSGDWKNEGTIRATGGTVILGQSTTSATPIKTANIGTIEGTLGTIQFVGVIDNTNDVFSADEHTGSLELRAEIRGGIVRTGGGSVIKSSNAVMRNVTLEGDVELPSLGHLSIYESLVLDGGTIRLRGNHLSDPTRIVFRQNATFSGNGDVIFDGNTDYNWVGSYEGDLTLGKDIAISSGTAGGIIGETNYKLVNYGTIRSTTPQHRVTVQGMEAVNHNLIEAAGGKLTLKNLDNRGTLTASAGAEVVIQGAWSNSGSIGITDSTVQLYSGSTVASIGDFHLERSTFRLNAVLTTQQLESFNASSTRFVLEGGTIANTGDVFELDSSVRPWTFQLGSLVGGTVHAAPGSTLALEGPASNSRESLTLDGVMLDADVSIGRYSNITIKNGLHLDSRSIRISGVAGIINGSSLIFDGTQQITGQGEVIFDGLSTNNHMWGLGNLTIGPDISVRTGTGGGTIWNSSATGQILNQGTISAATAAKITVSPFSFANEGSLEAGNGGSIEVISNTSNGGPLINWENRGTMTAGDGGSLTMNARLNGYRFLNKNLIKVLEGGKLTLAGNWKNEGTIELTDGTLWLGGTFTPADIGTVDRTGGEVAIAGTLDATGSSLALNASTGSYILRAGGKIVGGTVSTADTAQLLVGTGTSTIEDTTISGNLELMPGAVVTVQKTVQFSDGNGPTGPGALVFPLNNGHTLRAASGTLEIARDTTVRTTASISPFPITITNTIGAAGTAVINRGTVSAEARVVTMSLMGEIDNQGLFEARNGSKLQVGNPALLSNLSNGQLTGGKWHVYANSTVDLGAAQISVNAAEIILSGAGSTFNAIAGLEENSGSFFLQNNRGFTTTGDFINRGTLTISEKSHLAVTGDFSQDAEGTLSLVLGGTGADQFGTLATDGTLFIGGKLEITLLSNYVPEFGQSFAMLFGSTLEGEFSTLSLPALSQGLSWDIDYGPNVTTLSVVPEPAVVLLAMIALPYLRVRRR